MIYISAIGIVGSREPNFSSNVNEKINSKLYLSPAAIFIFLLKICFAAASCPVSNVSYQNLWSSSGTLPKPFTVVFGANFTCLSDRMTDWKNCMMSSVPELNIKSCAKYISISFICLEWQFLKDRLVP